MKFDLMLPAAIEADWERIGALLAPAIAHDHARQAIDVYRDLMHGDMALFDIDLPNAAGIAVIEFDERTCWIIYVSGRIGGKPREWRGRVGVLMSYFEGIARANDCNEMRVEGRDWHRIFPHWERLDNGRNELRKAL